MSSVNKSGSCLCGSVRFTLTAEPLAVALCHCRDCQKQTGSSFSLVALVPLAALQVSGATATVETRADSGHIAERSFCPKCGSPVRTDTDGTRKQGITILKAGLLDDARDLRPTLQVYCDSEQSWLPNLAQVARFPRMPPG